MSGVLLLWTLAWLVHAVRRWAWVAQLEHYIPGSCRATWRRWLSAWPLNRLLYVLGFVLLLGTAAGPQVAAACILLGAPLLAVVPVPMMADPRHIELTLTGRVRRLLLVLAGLVIVLTGFGTLVLAALGGSWPAAMSVMLLLVAVVPLMDVALRLAEPLERRESERFRSQAEATLRRVDPLVIAITGSYGKTSVKNHLRDLMTGHTAVLATPASWNNTNGLSRAINEQLHDDHRVFIAEMGTYGPGEIAEMVQWVRPSIVAISAIGPMHLERMGSLDGVLEAKSEILDGARTVVLWVDDERLSKLAGRADRTHQVIRVGSHRGRRSDLDYAVEVRDNRVIVRRGGTEIGAAPAGGGLHPGNIGVAVALAAAAGIDDAHIATRLAALEPPPHRTVVSRSDAGVVVIDNTFNANPEGAAEAVHVLSSEVGGRKVVVTPGMVELGPLAEEENARLARTVADAGAELVVVGRVNAPALLRGAADGTATTVRSREEARLMLRTTLASGDGVLWLNDLPPHYP